MPVPPPPLDLSRRTGLPDEVAYLRASYAQAAWRQHRNFGGLASLWLDVHEGLRGEAHALGQATTAYLEGQVDPGDFRRAFVPRINRFLSHLDGHHQIEDSTYFPRFRQLDPRMRAGFDLLDADHRQIHQALLAAAHSAQALVEALGRVPGAARAPADAYAGKADDLLGLLLRHLADEEDLIVPALLHHGEHSVG